MINEIQHLISLIPGSAVLGTVGVIVEAVLRIIPSQKPLSLLYFAADVAKASSDLLAAISGALNNVLPQRIAQAPVAQTQAPTQA